MAVMLATTDAEIRACWPVMVQLRPHLKRADFVAAIRRQFDDGYELAFLRRGRRVAAVAGFRILHNLAWSRFCYVDDLVTDERERSRGCGAELFQWLCRRALSQGCARLELDSGVQRYGAHRFYLRHRMFISCHHFSLELAASAAGATPAEEPAGRPGRSR